LRLQKKKKVFEAAHSKGRQSSVFSVLFNYMENMSEKVKEIYRFNCACISSFSSISSSLKS
jgi:hypothetical protein